MPLTDLQIRQLKPDPSRVYRKGDGGGLLLEVRKHGTKLWIFKYQYGGRERRISFGVYPSVSLTEARDRREVARRQLRDGMDPGLERKRAAAARTAAAAASVRAVSEAWIATLAKEWSAGYVEDVRRSLELHIYPRIGNRPIATVTAGELKDILTGITKGGRRHEMARRLRQRCEGIWAAAIVAGHVTDNIAEPLAKKGHLPRPIVQGFRAVAEEDLPTLLAAVRGYGNVLIESAVLLQILTATRPGETRGARWDEFDDAAGLWAIPEIRMKRKERGPHLVPLSSQARAVLDRLRGLTGHGEILFPSRSRPGVPMSNNTVGIALRRLGFEVHPHGFRKLFSTVCHGAGHRSELVELSLAHVDTGVRGIYDKSLHLEGRRELLQWWGDRVEALTRSHAQAAGIAPLFPL